MWFGVRVQSTPFTQLSNFDKSSGRRFLGGTEDGGNVLVTRSYAIVRNLSLSLEFKHLSNLNTYRLRRWHEDHFPLSLF